MSFTEQFAYCLSLIEKKANFGPSEEWTSKDYENLSLLIERETRVSISVSTLRRLWNSRYEGSPQKATMDALAKYAGFSDWLSFVQEAHPPTGKSGISRKRRIPYIYALAAIAVLVIAALIYFKRPPAGGEGKGEILVLNKHQSGPETAVVSTAGNTVVLGQPMEQKDILTGEIGWNAVVYTSDEPLVLETDEFISDRGLDAGSIQLSGKLEMDLPGMDSENGKLEIKLATGQDGIMVQWDTESSNTLTQIGDTMYHNEHERLDINKQSVLSFLMASDQNTFSFHLNDQPFIFLDSIRVAGDLFAISFFSEGIFALRGVEVKSATDNTLVFQLLD